MHSRDINQCVKRDIEKIRIGLTQFVYNYTVLVTGDDHIVIDMK